MAEATPTAVADTAAKRFECHICQTTYSRKDTLDRHLSTHSDSRPFKCSECGKDFKLLPYLKQHMARVHSNKDAEDGKHSCVVCQKIFRTKAELAKHEKDEPHKCLICVDLTYRDYLESLRSRSEDDDGGETEKPSTFQCEFCDMAFGEKIAMYHHLHTDHMDKVGVN